MEFPLFKEIENILTSDEIDYLLTTNTNFEQACIFNRESKQNEMNLSIRKCNEVLFRDFFLPIELYCKCVVHQYIV